MILIILSLYFLSLYLFLNSWVITIIITIYWLKVFKKQCLSGNIERLITHQMAATYFIKKVLYFVFYLCFFMFKELCYLLSFIMLKSIPPLPPFLIY
jgi:hypothetical protein